MTRIDLITGFLGSGKTTFLLGYARYLLKKGERIGIFTFDRGPVNVDLPFFRELRGENCEIEMLAGCCDAESHQRRFKTRLIAMGMSGYDRVLLEPSGVFDVDEFYDTLQEPPLDRWYEIGSVIAVADAKLEDGLGDDADYLLASQAAGAGCILLSRTQLASEEEIAGTVRHLKEAFRKIRCSEPVEERIFAKDWSALTDEDYGRLSRCGRRAADFEKTVAGRALDFHSVSLLDLPLRRAQAEERIRKLFSEPETYGGILRVKGILEEDGSWLQINATKKETNVSPAPPGGRAMLVIGSSLKEDAISALLKAE